MLPKFLWFDAVLSAYHLINRILHLFLMVKIYFHVFILTKVFFFMTRVFGCSCFVQDLSLGLSNVFSLGILELRKDIGSIILSIGSILCLQMSHSLNLFHTSLHNVQLLHQSLSLFHCLRCCLLLLLLLMSLRHYRRHTTEPHAPKSLRDFTQYTGREKFLPMNQFRSTPLQWKVHLLRHPSLLILMILLLYAKVNDLVLIFFLQFHFLL